MVRWKSILLLLVLIVILEGVNLIPASAQETIRDLQISSIDISGFPSVKVQFQAIGSNNEPITDLTSQTISVSENGTPVQFSMDPFPTGIRVVFLIDAGQGLNASGSTGDTRISEIKSAIKNYLSQMNVSDSVMILAQEGDKTNVISDFTSSATDLQNSLNGYQYNATQASSGYTGLLDALSRLNQQTDGKKTFIIFLSSGIQNQTPDIYKSMVSQLSGTNHPTIHALLFRGGDDGFGDRLVEISKLGGGSYSLYTSQEVTNSIYQSMGLWRNQYLIIYRSPSASTGNRQVVIATASNNIPASKTYNITLQQPQVTIQDPTANSTIIRKPTTSTSGQTGTGTDYSPLKVKIEWPDGHSRKLTNISVLVNNQPQGTVTNPTVDNTGLVEVPWDLRTYTQLGQNPVSIQVQVTDELGMTGTSTSTPVIVLVQPDACKGLPNFLCSAVLIFLPYSNFLALGIALVALALVVVFRRQIATVGAPVMERVGDFVTRVTKRRTVSTPKAYLEALEGVDSGRTTFEIYGTTPIGRSRRHAELIFHGTDDNSPISRLHCTILDEDGTLSIRDEDSQWGTYLNGKKLESLESVELHDNDLIELANVERGGVKLRFTLVSPTTNSDESNNEDSGGPFTDDDEGRITKPRRR